MRYGIFSDIHSNLEAFLAVREAYKQENIGRYLCLGDIVSYATDHTEVLRLTRELAPVIIAGNHDWGVSGKLSENYFNERTLKAVRWTAARLNDADKAFLGSLPLTHAEENFILVHSTLDQPEEFFYLTTLDEVERTFKNLNRQICFLGHTHQPGIFVEDTFSRIEWLPGDKPLKLEKDKRYIVNTGSVGQPRDGDPRACLVVYDTDIQTVEIKRVEYDFIPTQEKIFDAGLPEFFATRLGDGK